MGLVKPGLLALHVPQEVVQRPSGAVLHHNEQLHPVQERLVKVDDVLVLASLQKPDLSLNLLNYRLRFLDREKLTPSRSICLMATISADFFANGALLSSHK